MRRLMIQADEDLLKRAKQRASERGVSIAQIVREALERELAPPAAQPEIRCVGVFASESGDLSGRATDDEYRPAPFR